MIAELATIKADDDQERARQVMIGGAPYLMAPLATALQAQGLIPIYAFAVRDVVEEPQADGTVRKVVLFRHAGWVPAV